MSKNVNVFSIAVILLLLSFTSSFAQRTTAEIVGTVTDETGGVLPGVEVVITNLDTALTRSTFSDDSGNYHVRLLPVGRYSVSGELVGFKKQEISGIILQVDQVARIDLGLEVGEITELVEVEGTAPLTKTDAADIGMVIENQQIEELPLRGENSFVDMVSLDAGAAKVSGHLTSIFTDLFGGMTNAYGSPPDGSRFMIDGVDVKDTAYSRIDIRLSGNATREMKSQMNSHSAEFGMNSGIQVNMVTKSGTNEIHGNVFWDHRNSAVNARNFFDPSRESRVREGLSEVPILQFNIFGASIGGPIVQDKTFFFFNYQGTRENKSLTRPASVPTMKMRNGDFSEILPGTVIRDPLTGDPFPGNIIPENRIHPVARNMMFGVGEVMPLWPVPDRPGLANNILPSRVQEQVFDQFVFRVDHSVTDSDNVYVRYIYDKQDRVLRYNKFLHQLPDYNDIFATPAHNARVGWTKVMGASAVNELKLGVNRMTQTLEDEIYGTPVPKLLGIEGTSTLFQYNPWVAASGFSRTGTLLNAPNNRVDNTYLAGDTISWNVGSHALGFGGEWREREQNGGSQPIPNGYFIFGPFYTGYSMADLMLGYHRTAITGREDGFGNYSHNNVSVHFKDTWKVSSNLTLDLGLRWDYFSPYTDSRDRISQFDPSSGLLVLVGSPRPTDASHYALPDAYGVAERMLDPLISDASWPHGRLLQARDLNNWAPRVGLALRPFGGNATVIRASYGIFYTPFDTFYMQRVRFNKPFVNQQTFVNQLDESGVPVFTIDRPFPEGSGIPSSTGQGFQADWAHGYNQQYNVTVEQALSQTAVFELGYIGNKGTKLIRDGNLNQAPPGPGSRVARRPYQNWATVGWRQPTANSSYHGMRVNLKQGFSNGFLGNISYVYSKWLDCGGNNLFADLGDSVKRNPFDCAAEWGRSSSDYRQRFVYNFVYQIPIMRGSGHGLAGAILGDWNISSIGTFSSSGAVDVASPFDPDNSGGANRPDLTGDPNSGAPRNAQQWFNTRAFTRVPNPADTGVYRFGNAGRNVIDGPGWTTVDFSIWKSWHVAQERARVEFRVDFFNITNHTNFDLPNTLFTGGAFATMGNAGNSRHLQFGLDIDF